MRAATLIAATALAASVALPASAEQPLPVYPGAVHTRIGNDLVIDGQHFRLAYFTTPDSMQKVGQHFVKHWKEQGYPTVAEGDFREEGVVSALYTREGLQRAVVLRRHMGKTVGFTALRDLWVRPGMRVTTDGAVKLEGTLLVSEIGSRDEAGSGGNRSLVAAQPWKVAYAAARDQLADKGFKPLRETMRDVDGKEALVLEHERGKAQIVTVLTEVAPGITAVVQTFSNTDRPDGMPNDDAVKAAKRRHEAGSRGAGEKK